jgi:hypothetical protein
MGRYPQDIPFPMFQTVQKTGVIFATSRAEQYGFSGDDPTWANMGQVRIITARRKKTSLFKDLVTVITYVGSLTSLYHFRI